MASAGSSKEDTEAYHAMQMTNIAFSNDEEEDVIIRNKKTEVK